MAPIPQLRAETETLPLLRHLCVLCFELLAQGLQPSHPLHDFVTSERRPRPLKFTIQSIFLQCVQPYIEDSIIPLGSYRCSIRSLHTDFVSKAKEPIPKNKALNSSAPPVASEETTLPRPYRTALVQRR